MANGKERKIYVTERGGMYVKPTELLADPDVQKKMEKFHRWAKEMGIPCPRAEVNEYGHLCLYG